MDEKLVEVIDNALKTFERERLPKFLENLKDIIRLYSDRDDPNLNFLSTSLGERARTEWVRQAREANAAVRDYFRSKKGKITPADGTKLVEQVRGYFNSKAKKITEFIEKEMDFYPPLLQMLMNAKRERALFAEMARAARHAGARLEHQLKDLYRF